MSDPTRRALLAGTVAAAIGGSDEVLAFVRPSRTAATIHDADAELRRLEREWKAKLDDWREADRRRDEAAARYRRPEEPEAVLWRESDAALWDAKITTPEYRGGKPTGRASYEHQTTLVGMRVALEELRSEKDFFLGKQLREQRIARLEEILDAHDAWVADRNRAWTDAGMEEAERAFDDVYAEMIAIRRQIAFCEAATSAGIMIKIRVATWCFGDTEAEAARGLREAIHEEELPTGEALACSILLDFVRLAPSIAVEA